MNVGDARDRVTQISDCRRSRRILRNVL